MTLAFNIAVLICLLFFIFYLLQKEWRLFFLYGLLVFQALTIVPSLIYIEEGAYISEQGRDSFFVGAAFFYVVYFIITFVVLKLTFNSLQKVSITAPKLRLGKRPIERQLVLGIAVFSLLILLLNAAQSKLPMFDGSVTRFTYWRNSAYPFLNKIFGNVSVFIPFCLGIVFKKHKKTAIFFMMVYFIYNFLIGQKFSPIVSGVFAFILPNALSIDLRKVNLGWIFNKKVLLGFVLVFSASYYAVYKRYEYKSPYEYIGITDPNEAIVYRAFGLQGHLFWGTVERYMINGTAEHTYNLADTEYGMIELMSRFMPNPEYLADAIDRGASFTNGYPSVLLMIYPAWMAVLVHIFFTITILGFIGWLLYQFVIKEAYLMAVIAFQFFNWVIYSFTMGYFYKLKIPVLFALFMGLVAVVVYLSKKRIVGQVKMDS